MITPVLPTYARYDVTFDRGEGSWLWAVDGRRYVDFTAGIAVHALGHAHPKLVAALTEQAKRLWHVSNLYRIPEQEALARLLIKHSFADTVFFTNSGAEALECAIKTARKYQSARGNPQRWRVVAFQGAFHGRTLATIAAAGGKKLLDGFGPPVDGFDPVPLDDDAALEAAIGPETAAILIEPIQGEGGVRVVAPARLRRLRELCDAHGLLLMFDEVQCGMGRTGKLWAYERAGVVPDVMAVAKAIGGGFPLGACLMSERAALGMTAGTHGSTYGGNPLACAVGKAVVEEIVAPGFLEHVARSGLNLRQKLDALRDAHPTLIDGVRGEGLMLGLKMRVPAGDFVRQAMAAGVLTVPAAEDVVRVLPPLNVTDEDMNEGVNRLQEACAAFPARDAA